MLRLIQIPFSHNCLKVRLALARKGIAYDKEDIPAVDRTAPRRASGHGLVPVLVDGGTVVTDSTRILLHLEERFPDPPLVPPDGEAREKCLRLEEWADRTFMELSRRIAYQETLATPGALEGLFFPHDRGLVRWIKSRIARRVVARRFAIDPRRRDEDRAQAREASAGALERIGGRPYLVGEQPTIADLALAAMAAPLRVDPVLAAEAPVRELLAWGDAILGPEEAGLYRPSRR